MRTGFILGLFGGHAKTAATTNCGRIFKKYREEGYRKNIRTTLFCCRSCNANCSQKNKDSKTRLS